MREASVILSSTITCPICRFKATETMPTDACLYFYECKSCGAILRPKAGDCCVFLLVRNRSLPADPGSRRARQLLLIGVTPR